MKIAYVVARPLEINTSASLRNRAIINGLVELGHTVTLYCSKYDSSHPNFDLSIKSEAQKVCFLEVGRAQKLQSIGRNVNILNPVRKFIYKWKMDRSIYGDYSAFGKLEIINHFEEYDLIISSSDPKSSHLLVYNELNKARKEVPWIQIWGDPFMTDITRKSINNEQVFEEEKKLLSRATKIFYVSPLTLKKQRELFEIYSKKMFFVPIPFTNEKIFTNRNLKNIPYVKFLYAGDYNSNVRYISPLVKYFSHPNNKHQLCIAGTGDIKKFNKEKIHLKGRVSYTEIEKLEEQTDVLVFLSNKKGNQIPGKIYQYSGTNKPILFINDGEYKEQIQEYFDPIGRYFFCDNVISSIEKTVEEIIFSNQSFDPVDEFKSKHIAKKIITM